MNDRLILNNAIPVNQQIYRVLRASIVECSIPPGTLLSEKEISSQFNVSRQPVREAFIKLAENGLVRILPQRGTFVCKISEKRVADGRFIREAIESSIIRKAAEQVTDAQLLMLEHNLKRQALAAENNQSAEFLMLDDEFHHQLTVIAGCELAWETIENIKAVMDRVRYLTLSEVSPPKELIVQHYRILEALQQRDPDAAENTIQQHLEEMIYSVKPIAESHQEWFEDV